MPESGIRQKLEQVSEALVLADLKDLQALAQVHEGLEQIRAWAEETPVPRVVEVVGSTARLVESIILQEVDDPDDAFAIVNKAVAALQQVIRDGREPNEVDFPQQLFGEAEEVPGETAADDKILSDFLARQPSVLEEMEAQILALEKDPRGPAFGEFRRQIHTLKGEAGMLGLADVERVCHVTEDGLGQEEGLLAADLLLEVKDWLARKMDALSGKGAPPESPQALLERLAERGKEVEPSKPQPPQALMSLPKEVSVTSAPPKPPAAKAVAPKAAAPKIAIIMAPQMLEGDPDLLGEFVSEAREHLENADLHLLTLETEPSDQEALNAVFRAFHTIKGVAGFLSLNNVQALSHEAENLLDKARKGDLELKGPYIDVTFDAVDMLKLLVGHVAESLASREAMPPIPELPELVSRLNAVVSGQIVASERPSKPSTRGAQRVGEILVEQGQTTQEVLDAALEHQIDMMPSTELGEMLIRRVLINRSQLEEALALQEETTPRKALGKILVEMGAVRWADILACLQKQAEGPETPKLGELLVKSGETKAKDVAQALRTQRQQAVQAVEVREAVKVDADRLDRLIDLIGELVIAESMVSQSAEISDTASSTAGRQLNQLDKITRELQEMGMSLRMVAVRATFQKMARLVRDLAKKAGKKVEFSMAGEDTELDKSVVDKIGDPLVHMVRNAVDHGIEATNDERIAADKPEAGHVELRAFHKGGSIHIEIQDDGRGLDRDAILAKGRERGLVKEGETLAERDIWNLIFEPGFSTAKQVTDVSGRGVGMDVVKRNIEALRGQVEIQSEKGRGTTFSIRLPLTLAIIDGMVVRVGQERYIIPTLSVVRSIRPEASQIFSVVKKGEMLSIQGQLIPMFRLDRLFGVEGAIQEVTQALVVVVEDEGHQAGLLTDELLGQQQIVIKSLGESLSGTTGISGGAIMPDGHVGLIVDVGGVVKLANSDGRDSKGSSKSEEG